MEIYNLKKENNRLLEKIICSRKRFDEFQSAIFSGQITFKTINHKDFI